MSGGVTNPTELVASLISEGLTIVEGIRNAQERIEGSCSLLMLTNEGIYAARDRFGRTPLIIGKGKSGYAVTMETCAFHNLEFEIHWDIGPGEIVLMTPDGCESRQAPGVEQQICAFLWIYYGYPSSCYEGRNVEAVRNLCGEALAKRDNVETDIVAGIPDSGTGHAIGYANAAGLPYKRPFVKYIPTWPRSFMPQDQKIRDLIAQMKLMPIRELIDGKRTLFAEDSIVRGTQLRGTIKRVFDCGAREVHMRVACPPLVYGCPYLNFSRSKSELNLAARRVIRDLEGHENTPSAEYLDHSSDKHIRMVEKVREMLGLTTLRYQLMPDMISAIGLPKEKVCTYCWEGPDGSWFENRNVK